jgi:hypothetical protein
MPPPARGIFAGRQRFLLLLLPQPLYQASLKLLFFLVSFFSKAEKEEKGVYRGLKVRENQNFLEVARNQSAFCFDGFPFPDKSVTCSRSSEADSRINNSRL